MAINVGDFWRYENTQDLDGAEPDAESVTYEVLAVESAYPYPSATAMVNMVSLAMIGIGSASFKRRRAVRESFMEAGTSYWNLVV